MADSQLKVFFDSTRHVRKRRVQILMSSSDYIRRSNAEALRMLEMQ